ncbi:MAG: hypothetical protein F6K50_08655 [Moorea sp. SIO3I7]|uniref:hypothetical protein n=1 Tax=Moorena sp. SIO3I8 TaxID=2607833 RepID=UPI0013C273A8|nr:hypothetical protein [Moorena sp. SIO3I8]NEN95594.1 hypothetical protein [Moorena sp. SIO3I7]NEO08202.1 hypothetical protein [Moorena sp. SIO3I8]
MGNGEWGMGNGESGPTRHPSQEGNMGRWVGNRGKFWEIWGHILSSKYPMPVRTFSPC